eukprot:6204201-Pleurochrysis_carterae.AAC.6
MKSFKARVAFAHRSAQPARMPYLPGVNLGSHAEVSMLTFISVGLHVFSQSHMRRLEAAGRSQPR